MTRLFFKKLVLSTQVRCHTLGNMKWHIYRIARRFLRLPHEPEFAAIPDFRPKPSSLFLDIGAHLGQSIDSIRIYAPESPIISFEPNPLVAAVIRRHFVKDRRLTVEECALGSADGQANFYIPIYNGYVFSEEASTERPNPDWLKQFIWKFQENKFSYIQQTWSVRRLDAFNLEPFFIKVDCVVKELEFVRGGIATIAKFRPILMVEGVSYEGDLSKMLEPLGYQMYRYQQGHFVQHSGLSYHAFLITEERLRFIKSSNAMLTG